jgi:hypothetical protein
MSTPPDPDAFGRVRRQVKAQLLALDLAWARLDGQSR